MAKRFGALLRQLRHDSKKTIGQIARLLDVSVVYVSDIERGNRRPFAKERILEIAHYLDTDPGPLLEAADTERGIIEFDISKGSQLENQVVSGLVTGLARGGVSEEQLRRMQRILREHEE